MMKQVKGFDLAKQKEVMMKQWYGLLITYLLAAQVSAAPTPIMTLSTDAFRDKMAIPVLYTCDGKDISPQLSWSDAPKNTVSFAVMMKDIDSPSGVFFHWGLYNIPATTNTLAEGSAIPAHANTAFNSFNRQGYNGPCPPKGNAHTYVFTLYALNTQLTLPGNIDDSTLEKTLKAHIISRAELRGVYSRWVK